MTTRRSRVASAAGQKALPLSVLHVVHSLNPGGAERTVIDLITRLVHRIRVAVCCLDEPGAWASEVVGLGVPVTTLHRQAGFHPTLGFRIADLARRHEANVLHCHQYTPFVYGRIAAIRRRNLRIVFTEQGRLSDSPPPLKRRFINPLLGRLRAQVFAVSADLRRHMIASGFPAGRVGIIPNAIEPGTPPPARARTEAREMLGISERALVIGSAARLDPVKDLGSLVEAVARIRPHSPDVELLLVGDGPEREPLENQVRAAGLKGAVHFTGYRSDVRRVLPALDIYVNCSTSEGISLTILEAMASSLPVVATRVGGNPEVVAHNESGLLVPARSPQDLANTLLALAADPQRRAGLGMAGRRRLEEQFTVQIMVERYMEAYGQAVRPS